VTEKTWAVVTGAAGDIGQAIASRLAPHHRIITADMNSAGAEEVAERLRAGGAEARALTCDITDDASVEQMARAAMEFGPVRVLVNNAGAARDLSLHAATTANTRADLNLNLEGAMRVFKALEPHLILQGNVVNIASVNGLGVYGHPAYSAAKAGLIHFTRMLAVEYGRYGMRANVVAPGTVETRAWLKRKAQNPAVLEEAARWYPLRRVAKPGDVAEAVGFLVSPLAGAITGVCLPVDCGLTAGSPALPATFTQTTDFTGFDA
jgi:NAD(P)-dependent dehydrogenase (short-subunit alcohol dehydrogenase family)